MTPADLEKIRMKNANRAEWMQFGVLDDANALLAEVERLTSEVAYLHAWRDRRIYKQACICDNGKKADHMKAYKWDAFCLVCGGGPSK